MITDIGARLELRESVEAYFSAIDRRDWKDLARCFADEAEVVYQAGSADEQRICGRDAIVSQLKTILDRLGPSNHTISNMDLKAAGGRVNVTTFAVVMFSTGPSLVMRGLRYDDEWTGGAGGWSIACRRHSALWQAEVPAGRPGLPPLTHATR
jgi:hypothetical protein